MKKDIIKNLLELSYIKEYEEPEKSEMFFEVVCKEWFDIIDNHYNIIKSNAKHNDDINDNKNIIDTANDDRKHEEIYFKPEEDQEYFVI